MITPANIINISQGISALANVYEGINSPHYPILCRKTNNQCFDFNNHQTFLENIRNEAYKLNQSSLRMQAENFIEIEARCRLIKDIARIFGLGSVPVARSARALSSDAYQVARLNR